MISCMYKLARVRINCSRVRINALVYALSGLCARVCVRVLPPSPLVNIVYFSILLFLFLLLLLSPYLRCEGRGGGGGGGGGEGQ